MYRDIDKRVIVHRRDAEYAEKINIFLKPLRHYMIMDINKLSGKIIGAAIEVHKALGPGLLEFHPVKYLPREMLAQ